MANSLPSDSSLQKLIRVALPSASSGILVGSALRRGLELVEDVDLIAFIPGCAGEKIDLGLLPETGLRAECTVYDPTFPKILLRKPGLRFFHLREARRILGGRQLFGGEELERIRTLIGSLRYSAKLLRKILKGIEAPAPAGKSSTINLIVANEALLLVSGCLFGPDGPSKPKWYFADSTNFYPTSIVYALTPLVEAVQTIKICPHLLPQITLEADSPVMKNLARDVLKLNSEGWVADASLTFSMLVARVVRQKEYQSGLSERSLKAIDESVEMISAELRKLPHEKLWDLVGKAVAELERSIGNAVSLSLAHPLPTKHGGNPRP